MGRRRKARSDYEYIKEDIPSEGYLPNEYGWTFEYDTQNESVRRVNGDAIDVSNSPKDYNNDEIMNPEGFMVSCKKCGSWMLFDPTRGRFGKYICPICGATFSEEESYKDLENEYDRISAKYPDYDLNDEDDLMAVNDPECYEELMDRREREHAEYMAMLKEPAIFDPDNYDPDADY